MSITIPTSAQIGAACEAAARTIAAIAVAVYVAGEFAGRLIHKANDWLADASHHPGQAAGQALELIGKVGDAIIPPAPNRTPSAMPLIREGAILMTVREFAEELEAYDKYLEQRKRARARKVKAAA